MQPEEIKRFVIGDGFAGEVEKTDGLRLMLNDGLEVNKSAVRWSVEKSENFEYMKSVLASRDWAIEAIKAQALKECYDVALSDDTDCLREELELDEMDNGG